MRFLLIFLLLSVACGFSPSQVQGPFLTQQAPPLPPAAEAILGQPFHYLGQGRQCFVFESADQKVVLKFFNRAYFQMPWYSFWNPAKEQAKRALRRHFYEHSYSIAFQEFGEEILYLHLGPSEQLPTIQVKDSRGKMHAINLNTLPFVLQKKGIPFYEGLTQIYKKEGLSGLYREIDLFLTAIARRIEKGIADDDSDVEHNWGYAEGHLFHLDPGRLYLAPNLTDPVRRQKEWNTATRNFHRWLTVHYPPAAQYMEGKLKGEQEAQRKSL